MRILRNIHEDVPGTTWVLFLFAVIFVGGGIWAMHAFTQDVSADTIAALVTAGVGVFGIHIGHVTGRQ